MKTNTRIIPCSLAITLLLALLLAACGGTTPLSTDEATTFANQIAENSENLLLAINAQDYDGYVSDMDEQMRSVSTEDDLAQLYETIVGRIGDYVPGSLEMTQVLEQEPYYIVIYTARFEQEDGVTVRVVYDVSGAEPLISGLWFDSPQLRQQE